MQTQCPHCDTIFVIAAAHLRAAHGKVKCGRCAEVFDAIPHLIDERPGASTAAPEAAASAPERSPPARVDAASAAYRESVEAAKRLLGSPSPVAPAVTPAPGTPTLPDTPAPAGNRSPGSAVSTGAAPAPGRDDSPEAGAPYRPVIPSDAGPPGQDEAPDAQSSAPGSSAGETPSPDAAGADATARAEVVPDAPDETSAPSPIPLATPEDALDDRRPDDVTPGTSLVPVTDRGVPEALHDDLARAGAPRRGGASWLVGAFALLLVLVAQYAWFQPLDLVKRYPQTLSVMERWCAVTGCSLTGRREPDRIRVITRDVRVHPRYEGALQVTATLVNTAPYSQPYPRVRFSVFNVNGETIASRTFDAHEYLGAAPRPGVELAPRTPLQIALEMVAPEQAAISFEFDFL